MKTLACPLITGYYSRLFLLAATLLLTPGCASRNVNPPQARAHTGYVDLRAEPPDELSWDVARYDEHSQGFKSVFWELEPPPDGALRLAFAPGHHRLRVTFLNRVIAKPAEVEVDVQDGQITPVRVTLTEAGTALVTTKEENRGGTAKGRYGRRVKLDTGESVIYAVSAAADAPKPYQAK